MGCSGGTAKASPATDLETLLSVPPPPVEPASRCTNEDSEDPNETRPPQQLDGSHQHYLPYFESIAEALLNSYLLCIRTHESQQNPPVTEQKLGGKRKRDNEDASSEKGKRRATRSQNAASESTVETPNGGSGASSSKVQTDKKDTISGHVHHYYRLSEIEFYFYDKCHHPDPFTHKQPQQLTRAQWYFHKQGNSYRGGTWKGLDITFGRSAPSSQLQGTQAKTQIDNGKDKSSQQNVYGGILLRGMEYVGTSRDGENILPANTKGAVPSFICGPCKIVDTILAHFGTLGKSVASLVSDVLDEELSVLDREGGPLVLVPIEVLDSLHGVARAANTNSIPTTGQFLVPHRRTFKSPRVGLLLKRSHQDLDLRSQYVCRPYRFFSIPAQIPASKSAGMKKKGASVVTGASALQKGRPLSILAVAVSLAGEEFPETKSPWWEVSTNVGHSMLEKLCGILGSFTELKNSTILRYLTIYAEQREKTGRNFRKILEGGSSDGGGGEGVQGMKEGGEMRGLQVRHVEEEMRQFVGMDMKDDDICRMVAVFHACSHIAAWSA
ncbi:hypothetical protein HK102_013922 [Quaeritorhiza haematococci]|nr:hypothetical protein HK102_013922 [Quaeritorhiza haematococci]